MSIHSARGKRKLLLKSLFSHKIPEIVLRRSLTDEKDS
jgi:hypothetical protein